MNQTAGFPLLTSILAVNGLGALAIWLVPARRVDTWRWLAFLVSVTIFFISLFLYMGWVNDSEGALQFEEGPVGWPSVSGFQYHLGVDGINLHLIMLITFSMPMILIGVWTLENKAHMAWLLACETGLLGALMVVDLGGFVLFGSLALLTATLALGASTPDEPAARPSTRLRATTGPLLLTGLAVILLMVALGGKAWAANVWWAQTVQLGAIATAMGIVSMGFSYRLVHQAVQHSRWPSTWVLVNGLLGVLGIYGLIRFGVLALPLAATSFAPAMMLIGLLIAAWNALAMMGTTDYETALSRWTIGQVGLDVIGMFTIGQLGLLGVILRLIGRTLGLSALLLIPPQARQQRPGQVALAGGFLTVLGMPGLAGFPGLSVWLMALLRRHGQANVTLWLNSVLDWSFNIAVALTWLLAGWALLRLWHSLSPADESSNWSQRIWLVLPIMLVIVTFGLRPYLLIDSIGPTLHYALVQFNLTLQELLNRFAPTPPSPEPISAIGIVRHFAPWRRFDQALQTG